MVSLAIYSNENSQKNAEWTMRLINFNQEANSEINNQVTLNVNIQLLKKL